ncbi:hypothetical protein CHS0354_042193 [Potamilus streckersoni]|uniref:C2 domain-containing protein n=1 Tax=Potamilus streckersoni TaxID=2493646 RepID=A0AAE0TLG5_9BIVA|nr:hypothetical protein CHS0354_042193 [Potamilus streckersoni]
MFGKKTSAPVPPQRKGAALMNQMGLGGFTDMSQMETMMYGDLENDDELEAELMALQGEDAPKAKPDKRIGKGLVNPAVLDQMIAASVKDIPSDEEVSDTEDPELMAELEGMVDNEEDNDSQTPKSMSAPPVRAVQEDNVSLLQARIANYLEAVENAKATGDSSKQRRLERGLKTLQDLLKNVKAGKPIVEDEIPPPVVNVSKPKSVSDSHPVPVPGSLSTNYPVFEPTSSHENRLQPPQRSAPLPPAPLTTSSGLSLSEKDQEARKMLCERRDQYKHAALEAKRNGDINTATKYVRTAKQFDAVIGALEEGKPVDLSKMPPPPPDNSVGNFSKDTKKESSIGVSPVKVQRSSVQTAGKTNPEEPVFVPPPPSADEERALFNAPDAPKTVLEALQQRLQKYTSVEAEAKAENNSTKARRMGRIVKQYQDAIKDYKVGKPVNFDELPTPPGFGPIPVQSSALAAAPSPAPRPAPSSSAGATGGPSGILQPPNKGQRGPSPVAVTKAPISQPPQQKTQSPGQPDTKGKAPALKRSYSSRADYQANFLKERMLEYKNAAIQAKKNNNIELAKKYLRQAKGFEPMIDAAESGLPVDLTQVPPSLEDDSSEPGYVIVSQEDFVPSENREETFKNLEQDLIAQIQKCAANNLHFSKLGDVATATSFQKMEQGLKKDLEALKNSFRLGEPVPKFHYENRTFSMVQCNTDLGDNDIIIEVVRGIQYNPPSGYSEKDLDTYVKFEFPFPTEEPQVGQTDTVKGTFNPEYKHSAKLQINRKSRAFVRVVERKAIKFEVFYKRGFLKSDKLLGTVNVKFQPLESQCTAHDSYDLMDGRKAVGGKLEVKVRIRDPFKNKQVEEVKEKWLVIDQFLRTLEPKKGNSKSSASGTSVGSTGHQQSSTCVVL